MIYRVPVNYPARVGASTRLLQHSGFVAMNPDRHLSSHYDYFLDLVRGDDDNAPTHREFYDEYNAVLDMPAEYYLDTIKTVFQDFALVNGTWKVQRPAGAPAGHPRPPRCDGRGRARRHLRRRLTAAHGLCTGIPEARQFHYDVAGAGHYGIFSGRRWRARTSTRKCAASSPHRRAADRPGQRSAPGEGEARGTRPIDSG